jgi:hypothetical protein
MTTQCSELTRQFERHEVDASSFGHVEHVQVAYEMLQRHSFLDASTRYAEAINSIAIKAGAPEKFNVTITLAFMSLIAERLHQSKHANFEQFLELNEDLKSSRVLNRWYTKEQLKSDFARNHFLLPNKVMQS